MGGIMYKEEKRQHSRKEEKGGEKHANQRELESKLKKLILPGKKTNVIYHPYKSNNTCEYDYQRKNKRVSFVFMHLSFY